VLATSGGLTTDVAKPYWQPGWLAQHDRLMAAIAARTGSRLTISGDLHAMAVGRIARSGTLRFDAAGVTTVLSGPIGTGPGGWPSAFRGIGPRPPAHLEIDEAVRPIEQHGFTIVDFMPRRIVVRMFRWDVKTMPVEAIDRLEAFYTTELGQ
jgi:hypothetical protein